LKIEITSGLWGSGCYMVPFDDEHWGGWLGKYHETLRETVFDLDDPKARSRKRSVNPEW